MKFKMLTLLPHLSGMYVLACNTAAYECMNCSMMKLHELDDLFAAYCCIDFIGEI
jgi:hypothetical protein